MEILNSLSNGVITVAAILGALAVILRYARGPILNWLNVTTTPADVKSLLEEVNEKVDRLLAADSPPTAEELAQAMQTMERAGFVINDDLEETDDLTTP